MTFSSTPSHFPLRVACVDAGSNAIRFLVTEFSDSTRYETLYYERLPVRLGHQVFLNGLLDLVAMERTVRAFADFSEQLETFGVQHYRAVATSAVREARNGRLLVERIRKESGIELHVITGSEEARLVHAAVANRVDLSGGQWILVDLGGGSVEVSLVDDMGMLWTESHTMGSVRILELLSGTSPDMDLDQYRLLLEEYIGVLRIPTPAQYWEPAGFVATGGNIEALADVASAPVDDSGVGRLAVSNLDTTITRLASTSYTERINEMGMREDRADVILPASLVYRRLARLAGAEEILVPNVGVKDGILMDLVADLVSRGQHDAQGEAQIRKAALSLGRRFFFDENHALHVSELASSLFEQLQPIHGLPARQRLLLVAAALLHDIGAFIHHRGHHKHARYIVSRSELPGFSEKDMRVTANVARYHCGADPSPGHASFAELSPKHQARIRSLAAILRLADAMDRQQRQRIQGVRVDIEPGLVRLNLESDSEISLELWALGRRKSLFEGTFGVKVLIER